MTPLCELAVKHGTDKCSPVHQYTRAYHELFADRREDVKKVLEIGIGTKASMGDGYTPGASLRMWEEYFPNAEIWGADVDRSVLHDEGRVRCVYCDQGNADSLNNLRSQVGENIDLIVDDGSHLPEHQILTAQMLTPALAPSGVYFLEDLLYPHPVTGLTVAETLEKYFAGMSGFEFRLLDLPCELYPDQKAIVIKRC